MVTSRKYTHDANDHYKRHYCRNRLKRDAEEIAKEGESDWLNDMDDWINDYPLHHQNLNEQEREIECDVDRYYRELYWEYLDCLPFYEQPSDKFLREIGDID